MDAEPARLIIEALKEEKIDLFVTLPEEPTASLTQTVQADPFYLPSVQRAIFTKQRECSLNECP